MTLTTRRRLLASSLGIGIGLVAFGAVAQDGPYPDRPVRLISPWAPGGSADVTTRIVADRLSAKLNRQFVVEAKAGATGTIGHGFVAKSRADGYTLLLGSNSTYGIAPNLMKDLPYTQAELAPVALVATNPQVVCIHPSVPATDLASFVAFAKANPGKVTFGSGGTGGTSHMASALLAMVTGTTMTHVPYRGSGFSLQALAAGEVNMVSLDIANAKPMSEAGQVRALATSSLQRSPVMPNLPTVGESGYPGFDSATVFALFAPAGTPPAIIATLNSATNAILADPETRTKLLELGLSPMGGTPEELTRHVGVELEKWGRVVREAGVKLE